MCILLAKCQAFLYINFIRIGRGHKIGKSVTRPLILIVISIGKAAQSVTFWLPFSVEVSLKVEAFSRTEKNSFLDEKQGFVLQESKYKVTKFVLIL